MKRIINGKLYSTDTAERIADDYYSDGHNQYNAGHAESLWVTPRGRFFRFSETCWQGETDSIETLNEVEAKDVFESLAGDPEIYEKHFGKPEEG